jgi:uncharacterized protein with HEPN domain
MSGQRTYSDYLRDMLENAEKAETFVEGMDFETFSSDEKTVYAVVRAIEVIGEASKQVPEDVQSRYPQIPWRAIAGTRNKLIHAYFGVDTKVLWLTIEEDLPPLISELKVILGEMDGLTQGRNE